MPRIEVESRVVGAPRDGGIGSVFFEAASHMTVRELITRTVEEQVRDLNARRELTHRELERRFARQYLTENEILALREDDGRAAIPNVKSKSKAIDTKRAQVQAIEAFSAGRCIVFVGEEQKTDLDEEVLLGSATRVQFMRVLPLRGG